MKPALSFFAIVPLCLFVGRADAAKALELKDGDRVVLVGNTFIEREQLYGYWETALTSRFPERNITFRNLGWSGDTVFGDARAGFETRAEGYKRLYEHVLALKPTVILVGYGANEAFEGTAGLPRFVAGLNALLDKLASGKARIVLLSPLLQENLGKPFPNPTENNKRLRLYANAVRGVATERGYPFADLTAVIEENHKAPLTDNEVHLTAHGYRETAPAFEASLGLPPSTCVVEIDKEGKKPSVRGAILSEVQSLPLRFQVKEARLPEPPRLEQAPSVPRQQRHARILKIHALAAGKYTLHVDGKQVITASAEEWEKGMLLAAGPEVEQVEALRKAIVEKNRFYFHRWRPQNETYLYGFRKYEQGQNAREIVQFDPFIAKAEAEIARLRVPGPHQYEISRQSSLVATPAKDLNQIPDPDPEVERRTFRVANGFEVNLFASDPLLAKPIQMNFDSRGRLWVACSEVYPQIKPGQKANDKIIILEDRDGDGRADKTSVFADGLLIPTGVEPGDGGAYVADSTDLLHLADTDGDGKADKRRVVLSGFGTEDTHHILHTLRWGPDGMLYFNQSVYIHSHIETPNGVRRLNAGGVWQFRPETMGLEVFLHGLWNPWGHHFDRWGQSFVTDGAGGEGIHYGLPGAYYVAAPGATRVVEGLNPGSPKHCGLEIVSGRHMPPEWVGNVVTNDFRGHRVCRFVLHDAGAGYTSQEKIELIKTDHPAFRPVDVKMGPDGAIYIADWYNPIIQHGEVDFRDPRRDHTRGRIWRVTAKGRPLVPRPHLSDASVAQLLEALKAPEDWTRHHAKRVLKERGEAVLPALGKWLRSLDPSDPDVELQRLEALWTYQSLDRVEPDLLNRLLQAKDARVRAAATRVLQQWSARVPKSLELMANKVVDENPRVRLEAVRALARLDQPSAVEVALHVLDFPRDKFLDYALGLTVRETASRWLPVLRAQHLKFDGKISHLIYALQTLGTAEAVQPLVELLQAGKVPPDHETAVLSLIASLGGPHELGIVFERIVSGAEKKTGRIVQLLEALQQAARQRNVFPEGDRNRLRSVLNSRDEAERAAAARLAGLWHLETVRPDLSRLALAPESSDPLRQAAVDGLVLLGGTNAKETLVKLAARSQSSKIRRSAVIALASLDVEGAARLAADLLESAQSDRDPAEIFSTFLQRKNGAAILGAALTGRKLPADVAKVGVRTARSSGRESPQFIDTLSRAGGLKVGPRTLSGDELRSMTALVQKHGDPARGEAIFRRKDQACLRCHAIGGVGGQVGPDLTSIGASAPVDYLIESILLPNKAIKENYNSLVISTADGRLFTGIKVRETKTELVLRSAEDKEIAIPIKDIEEKNNGLSLMPEGLADTLTRGELADLVRFMSELGKVGPYSLSKKPVVRRWQVLEPTPAAFQLLGRTRIGSVAGNEPDLTWSAAYSLVSGRLPLEAIPVLKLYREKIAVARFQVEVTTPGKFRLKVKSPSSYEAWADSVPLEVQSPILLDLTPGIHTVTFALKEPENSEGLRCELEEIGGFAGQIRLVGGK